MTHNPPVEIERKFLVAALPVLQDLQAFQVRQGYLTLAADFTEVRLRQKADAYFMTVKSGSGLQRTEYEIPIDQSQFEALWPATAGRRVEKTRYIGHIADQQSFELDVFSGHLDSLVMVEVEFETLAAALSFNPPEWFGAELTDDENYRNKALASNGLPVITL